MGVNMRVEQSFSGEFLSSARIRGQILKAMQTLKNEAVKVIESSVSTFATVNVVFEANFNFAGGDAAIEISTENEIYWYLNDGTSERWAIMNKGFVPKTTPWEMAAGEGARHYNKNGEYTAIRGRQAMMERGLGPMPGIAGRHWDQQWEAIFSPMLYDAIEEAIWRGAE